LKEEVLAVEEATDLSYDGLQNDHLWSRTDTANRAV